MHSPSHQVWPISSVANTYAGARGSGSWISLSCSTSFQGGWRSGCLTTGMTGGLVGIGDIEGEKKTMKDLNDHPSSYLQRGPQVRDRGHYFRTIKELRAQIFASSVDCVCIVLKIDNASLATDDFRVKYETELAMHQSVDSDIHGLCKVIEDVNVTQLQLEMEIDSQGGAVLHEKKTMRKK
ncbi:hypothetical protein GH733_014685 [Mirounga leonina]|nr:hypothetical protein GH733_014685 [Mirounga leonina]